MIRWLRMPLDLLLLAAGLLVYAATGKSWKRAHLAMIRLFCLSQGRSNDFLSHVISRLSPPLALGTANSVVGELKPEQMTQVNSELCSDGYHIFSQRLSEETCRYLLNYANTQPALVRPMDGEKAGAPVLKVYDATHPLAVRYDFRTSDLIEDPVVQALMADPALIAVAQNYLGSVPKLDIVAMWWHTASEKPDATAAQMFHFDMDRIKWLKFFFYITDVAENNGPHCFIAGSQRSGEIPDALLKKGYSRLTDEEVARTFAPDRHITFAAPRGTIIAEDTRGLHKGRHVEHGHRLVFQLQFSNSLFGAYYPPARVQGVHSPVLGAALERAPQVFANFNA